MKKTFTLLFIICIQIIKAQIVTIPDANFVTWLQTNVPSAMSGNQMNITDPAVTTRTDINVNYQNISNISGIEYFTSLIRLSCNANPITNFPTLPNSLSYLDCRADPITTLSFVPNSLDTLKFNSMGISSLSGLPNSLLFLDCSVSLNLTDLGVLPSSLQHLECRDLPLNTVSSLPAGLKYFDCGGISSTIVNTFILPSSLLVFACEGCSLTILPILPVNLNHLACPNNNIASISSLPSSLISLDCSYNTLATLPALPSSLIYLNCETNQITNLPTLPNSIVHLNCGNNQITSLASLPSSLTDFTCWYNQISCFPMFPNNVYTQFSVEGNPISCVPNYVQGMYPDALNYPLCVPGNTVTNSNGCITSKGIQGLVYTDINLDCTKNMSELGITNGTIKLYDNSNVFLGLTNIYSNGFYYFNVPSGTYNVVLDTISKPFTVQCNQGIDSLITLTVSKPAEDSVDFAIICKPGFDVGVQSIYHNGIIFPGTTHSLSIVAGDMVQWNSLNCSVGVSGTVSFSVNGPVNYVGPAVGALIPSVIGNVYTYNIADFGTINNSTDFKIIFQTDFSAQAGDMVCINATITPVNGDNNPINNTRTYCYNVVNSMDPNIKEVYPMIVQSGFNDWLTYTIHFQNTGTAPAINIRLEDTLDVKLDPATLQIMNYSHYNAIDLMGNHLTIRFPNIQLADSTSYPAGSIGFIQYRIKPKASWTTDTVKNNAFIYFDYNAPIVTNTAKSYFTTVTGMMKTEIPEFTLIPNPTNGLLTINSSYMLQKVEIINIAGQTLLSEKATEKSHQLQLQNFADGIYFVKVSYNNGMSVTKKVIKR